MRTGWEDKLLKDICSVFGRIGFRGYTKADFVSTPDNGAITLSPSNIIGGELSCDKCSYVSWEKYYQSPEIMVFPGDILLVKTASIGKCALVRSLPHEATINPQFVVLKEIKVNHQYLTYFLQSPIAQKKFQEFAIGAAVPTFSQKKLEGLIVPTPSLPEQQRIVDILDREFAKIDALKANAEKSLQAAKDLFQATLKKELEPKEGWSINRLGDICTITSSKRIYKNEYVPDGIPFYRTKEVKEISNGRPISVELYISRERYNEIKQKFGVPQPNDILVSAVGTIGEMMIVRDNSPFYFKDGNLVWLKGITNADPEYLRYYLQSVINQIKGMTIGAAYSALTIEKFQEMKVALAPSLLEQQAIVSQLDDLNGKRNTLQQNYQKTLTLCDDLKQSLLRKAFCGEL